MTDIKRRDFIKKTTAVGVISLGVGSQANAQDTKVVDKGRKCHSDDPIALVPLTDKVLCSRIGLGTGVHGGMRQCNLTRMDRQQAIGIFQCAYDNGIRLFDLADLYGTHEIFRQALAGKPRDSYTIFTKLWPHPSSLPERERPSADIVIKRFLKELNVDYIDVVQVHCMMEEKWDVKYGHYLEEMEKVKEQGLIRAHGVTCHALTALRTAAENPLVDTIHTRLNNANIRVDGSWEDNVAALKKAHNNGKGTIIMKVLAEGAIKDPEGRKKSIDAIVRLDAADVMVVGFEHKDHITEFVTNVGNTLKQMKSENIL